MALIQQTSTQEQELHTDPAKQRFVEILHERDARQAQRLFYELFPEANELWPGPSILSGLMEPGQTLWARDLYPKHLEFFDAGYSLKWVILACLFTALVHRGC